MPVAVEGTKNVLNAAADMGVQRVVFTSSYGAIHMNPNRSPDQTLDEGCWSDPEFCKQTQVHYVLLRYSINFIKVTVHDGVIAYFLNKRIKFQHLPSEDNR